MRRGRWETSSYEIKNLGEKHFTAFMLPRKIYDDAGSPVATLPQHAARWSSGGFQISRAAEHCAAQPRDLWTIGGHANSHVQACFVHAFVIRQSGNQYMSLIAGIAQEP